MGPCLSLAWTEGIWFSLIWRTDPPLIVSGSRRRFTFRSRQLATEFQDHYPWREANRVTIHAAAARLNSLLRQMSVFRSFCLNARPELRVFKSNALLRLLRQPICATQQTRATRLISGMKAKTEAEAHARPPLFLHPGCSHPQLITAALDHMAQSSSPPRRCAPHWNSRLSKTPSISSVNESQASIHGAAPTQAGI